MINSVKIMVLLCLFLTSCTEKKNSQTTTNEESIELTQEIIQVENETKELEQLEKSMDEKARKLEKLLEELDN